MVIYKVLGTTYNTAYLNEIHSGCVGYCPYKKQALTFYSQDEKEVEATLKRFNYKFERIGKSETRPRKVLK